MPPLLHLSPPTKEGLRAPFGFPLGASARPFGRRAKNWLTRSDIAIAAHSRKARTAIAMSEGTSLYQTGDPTGAPWGPLGRSGKEGSPEGRKTHSKGFSSPLVRFCLLFPQRKRRSARRPKLLPPPPPQGRNFVIKQHICIFVKRMLFIQPLKKIIVCAFVQLAQLNNYTCTNIKLSSFIFCISASTYIAPTTLQFFAQFFLRYSVFRA